MNAPVDEHEYRSMFGPFWEPLHQDWAFWRPSSTARRTHAWDTFR